MRATLHTARRAARHIASRPAPARGVQRGLSIVELLVGTAIALFIAATGTTLLAGHLRESRSLLLEARLMQDLRTAADVVTRDLRRAGHWGAAAQAVRTSGTAGAVAANPYLAVAPGAAASDAASFRYSRDATENHVVDSNEQFGFRLRAAVIEMQLGAGNWQALTDPANVTITRFDINPRVDAIDLGPLCERPCPAGSAATCPPRQQVRSMELLLTGRLTRDAGVARSLRSHVRLRADSVVGACAA